MTRSATGIRNRALLILLYWSGLRIIEALVFLLADLNMAAQWARLRQTKSGKAQTRGWHPSADDALARWADKRRELGLSPRGPVLLHPAGAARCQRTACGACCATRRPRPGSPSACTRTACGTRSR